MMIHEITMEIPLVDLRRQYLSIQKDVNTAMLRVCEKADFILGEEVRTFETEFASYIGVKYCIGVASGTDAIKLMAMAAGITQGDEIIVQTNTFISTIIPFIELGAVIRFVDCDTNGQIDVVQVKKAITGKTRAVLPVDLYGSPAPVKELKSIAKNHHLLLLEDAAQAHGATVNGKKCGAFGDMAAFSFYPGKNLGAYGDGGAVVTNSKAIAEKLQILRNIGQKKKYNHTVLGTNSRLDTIQAAILSVKLRHLEAWNKKRREIAIAYIDSLTGVGDIVLPEYPPTGIVPNWHLFTIRTNKRNKLMKYLESRGIHCGIHYPVPLHLTPALKFMNYTKGQFPVAEGRAKTMLTLPLYAELTQKETAYLISTIRSFY